MWLAESTYNSCILFYILYTSLWRHNLVYRIIGPI